MMRWLALLAMTALAACGSGGRDPIVQAAIEEFGGFWAREDRVAEPPPRVVTRADLPRTLGQILSMLMGGTRAAA